MKPLETRESRTASRGIFEKIYEDYNRREYVSPDPLQFLYEYEDTVDREAVGLIASGLAYGRVAHILKSVSRVLDTLGPHPAEYLKSTSYRDHEAALCGFVHRFTGCAEICAFLDAIGAALREHGSIENLFLAGWRGDMAEAMENLSLAFCRYTGQDNLYLLPPICICCRVRRRAAPASAWRSSCAGWCGATTSTRAAGTTYLPPIC